MNRNVIFGIIVGFGAIFGMMLQWLNHPNVTAQVVADPTAQRPVESRATDEAAIRATAQSLAQAFEKGDAKAVAAFWTNDGEYVDESRDPIHGRVAIEKAYGEFFAKRPSLKVEGKTDRVRFLGPDTAVEEGTFAVRSGDSPTTASRYSALFARVDGKWQIALLKEWSDETTTSASIADLGWLIGTWEVDSPAAKVRTIYEWTPSKTFIRSHYTITNTKDKTLSGTGTQIIGVDPATGLIHAWTFEEDGSIGEANWQWDGSRWAIESTGTQPDGSTTTALNFMTHKNASTFTWHSVKRTENGVALPDVGPITVKKVDAVQPTK